MSDSWQTVGATALGWCQGGREKHSPEKTLVSQILQSHPFSLSIFIICYVSIPSFLKYIIFKGCMHAVLYGLARSMCFTHKTLYALLSLPHCGNSLSNVTSIFLYFLIGEQLVFLLFLCDHVIVNPRTHIKIVRQK